MFENNSIAVVIPAFNEEVLIAKTIHCIPDFVDRIYVIDDGSTDSTSLIVKDITLKENSKVFLVTHDKNRGVGAAIMTGYQKAMNDDFNIVVVIGADYQMEMEDFPSLLKPLIEGSADYSKGNRFKYGNLSSEGSVFKNMPKFRLFGNSILSLVVKIASGYWWIFDSQMGYTAITKEAIKRINWNSARKGYGYPAEYLIRFNRYNIRIADIPTKAIYLKGERQTHIKIRNFFTVMLNILFIGYIKRILFKYIISREYYREKFFYANFVSMALFSLYISFLIILTLFTKGGGHVTVNTAVLLFLFTSLCFQSWIFATFCDFQNSEKLRPCIPSKSKWKNKN